MFCRTAVLRKNPIVYKYGNDKFTNQLKHLLVKDHVHMMRWDPMPMFDPRRAANAATLVDHYTYDARYDPHAAAHRYEVPDQKFGRIPIPVEYKDVYWWRECQARRFQAPIAWVRHRLYTSKNRKRTNFQDLAFTKKHWFTSREAIQNLKDDLQ